MHQELPLTALFVIVDISVGVVGDDQVMQPRLTLAIDGHKGLCEDGLAVSQALHLGAFKDQAGFILLFKEEIVSGPVVLNDDFDAHGAVTLNYVMALVQSPQGDDLLQLEGLGAHAFRNLLSAEKFIQHNAGDAIFNQATQLLATILKNRTHENF